MVLRGGTLKGILARMLWSIRHEWIGSIRVLLMVCDSSVGSGFRITYRDTSFVLIPLASNAANVTDQADETKRMQVDLSLNNSHRICVCMDLQCILMRA